MVGDRAQIDLLVLRFASAAMLAVVAIGSLALGATVGGVLGLLLGLLVPAGCALAAGALLGAWPAVALAVAVGFVGPPVVSSLVSTLAPDLLLAGLVWWILTPVALACAATGMLARAAWRARADRRALAVVGMVFGVAVMALGSTGVILLGWSGAGPVEPADTAHGCEPALISAVDPADWAEDVTFATTARSAAESVASSTLLRRVGAGEQATLGRPEALPDGAERFPLYAETGRAIALVTVAETEAGTFAVTRVVLCR